MPAALLDSTARALAHRVATLQRDGRAPSVVAGVVRDGELAWSGSAGDVDPGSASTTAYRIGSITKSFVAVLILQLRDERLLDLTDPVRRHLPEVEVPVTVAQLLTHTAAVTSELPGTWWERVDGGDFAAVAAALQGQPLRLAPGTRLHYSSVGFALLGQVVARLRDADWGQVLRERILDPLGMARTALQPTAPYATGWAVHPHADVLLREPASETGAMGPAGQLWSTVADLARWAALLAGRTDDLVSPDTLAEMRRLAAVDEAPPWTVGWGLGLQLRRVEDRTLVGHGGSMPGFVAAVWTDPDSGDGAVVMANATAGVDVGGTADSLLAALAAAEPARPRPWRPARVEPTLLELIGTWYWGPVPHTLVVEGADTLRLRSPSPARSSRFRPRPDGTWVGQDSYYAGETLRVIRRGDGSVSHLDLATFVFTREPYDDPAVIPGGLDRSGWHHPE